MQYLIIMLLVPFFVIGDVDLAKACYKNQDQEKAFRVFLEALEEVKKVDPQKMSKEEEKYYNEALGIYLSQRADQAEISSRKIDEKFSPILRDHPDFYHLGYILAVADANLHKFDRFFDLFYKSYKNDPHHFLAYKTKAILHIKLFERSKTLEERNNERKKILEHLRKAQELYPADFSLYRLEIAYTLPENKSVAAKEILYKIANQNIIPSRSDTVYFAMLALNINDQILINKWLAKGLEWYPDSRTLKELKKAYGT